MRVPPGCDPESIVLTFPVAREFAGQRLDRFIQSRIPRLSRTRAHEIVRSCARHEDGRLRRPGERVKPGEVVLLVRPRMNEPEVPLDFGIVFEDEDILAIDKPAGLPMHPSATYHKHTLTYQLRQRYGDPAPHIAHRLDRETSGLVLCAKRLEIERALKGAFERREVSKTYLAIVEGVMEQDEGLIEVPMGPVREGLHVMMEVRSDGSPARTRYRVLGRSSGRTLVELFPETGRQHQLRVHLSEVGHPIVGDKLYGPDREAPFLEYIETGMTDSLLHRLGHDRQALHAHSLRIPNPNGDGVLALKADFAADLAKLWQEFDGAPLPW
ncbi:MAG: RluA family pseudouridine synthase [Myxococcales bacterium]|nr:RluA family pseudouridine synthase [Myxococcales bacterium]